MEIKFRAIGLDKNEWIYGYVAFSSDKTCCVIIHKQGNNDMQHTAVDPETVCQFTGLKDKNKVDIYQRDILKEIEYYGQYIPEIDGRKEREYFSTVDWGSEGWCHFPLTNTSCKSKESGYGFYDHPFEVVGNVIDNPDLLPEKNVNN